MSILNICMMLWSPLILHPHILDAVHFGPVWAAERCSISQTLKLNQPQCSVTEGFY